MTGCNFKVHASPLVCFSRVDGQKNERYNFAVSVCLIINIWFWFFMFRHGQKEQKARLETQQIWRRGKEQKEEEMQKMKMDRQKEMKIIPRRKSHWILPPSFLHSLLTKAKYFCSCFDLVLMFFGPGVFKTVFPDRSGSEKHFFTHVKFVQRHLIKIFKSLIDFKATFIILFLCQLWSWWFWLLFYYIYSFSKNPVLYFNIWINVF